jgi:hypothetical protein
MSLVSAWCYEVEVSATDGSLARGRPTGWGVSESLLKTSTMRRPRTIRDVESRGVGIGRRAQSLQAEELTANENTINEIPLHLSVSVHLPTIQP